MFLHSLLALSSAELTARLTQRVHSHGQCPVGRYLLGCCEFDAGHPALAVRHWMIAYHASWELESAAFLVFAGLKLSAPNPPPLLAALAATWEEYRRPCWGRHPLERTVFDAFPPPEDGPPVAAPHTKVPKQLISLLSLLPIHSIRAALSPSAIAVP